MKKTIILSLFALICASNCKKKNNPLKKEEVYCIFSEDGNTHIFHGCASSKTEMQNKMVSLRNQGYNVVNSFKKKDCSECQ